MMSRLRLSIWLLWVSLPATAAFAAPAAAPPSSRAAVVLSVAGEVYIVRVRTPLQKEAVRTNTVMEFGDRIQTGAKSRATLQLTDRSILRIPELTMVDIQPPPGAAKAALRLNSGKLYLNNRERPDDVILNTPLVSCAVRGTELVMEVDAETGRTTVQMLEGEAFLKNDQGELTVKDREQAKVEPGQAPVRTATVAVVNDWIQWCLYYPAVLDPEELALPETDRKTLAASLAAYAEGDLLAALAAMPTNAPLNPAGRVYHAALLLAVGQVDVATQELAQARSDQAAGAGVPSIARALEDHIATVQGATGPISATPTLATEWMVHSYRLQASLDLEGALEAAQAAAKRSPQFGFAWERIAELEFSFGRTRAARKHLEESIRPAPRNAQALALEGFLHAAANQLDDAWRSFDDAIAIDGALGNAWLGRGLVKIRKRQLAAGLKDLQTAAAQEPQRAVLRSYLGKAFSAAGDDEQALRELELAQQLDPNDPTSWFYRALVDYQQNRTADAIRGLDEAVKRNDNRQLYRSRLLLEQDRASRSASLANVYRSANMPEVSMRESARAVAADYVNASAHLNLAASYDALRDPTRFNLRYETLWMNEHLLASLLAPVGAVSLSQNLSQQEYSRLFEADRFGLNATVETFSDAEEVRGQASQYGISGGTSYALDFDFDTKNGVRPNNELDRFEWYTRIQQQLTPEDSVLLLVKYQDYESGDNFQYYDPANARPDYYYRDYQHPIVLGGYHHEWSPGMHTLFLGGWLQNEQEYGDLNRPVWVAIQLVPPAPTFDPVEVPMDVEVENEFGIFTSELSQIWVRGRHTHAVGLRYQNGTFDAGSRLRVTDPLLVQDFGTEVLSECRADFHRFSFYGYHTWEVVDRLMLTAGVGYDDVQYPSNYRRPPFTSKEESESGWTPKGALAWTISPAVTLRSAYSQTLGGVSHDQSWRLEPSQLVGFGQSYRTLISESLVGSVEAPWYEIASGALDLKLSSSTFLGTEAAWMRQEVERELGIFDFGFPQRGVPSSTLQRLDYQETYAGLTLNQILVQDWFLGAGYRFTHSWLATEYPDVTATPTYERRTYQAADLHELRLSLDYAPAYGFLARLELKYYAQQIEEPDLESDHFPQLNVLVGGRWAQRRAEALVGILNLTGEDYRLHPVTPYQELPREPTLYARFRVNF